MIKYLTIFLFFPTKVFAQNIDFAKEVSISQTVVIEITYKTPNKQIRFSQGCGFLIGGKYLVTAYHIFKPNDTLTAIKMIAHFLLTNDSVEVNLKTKYSKPQYNFNTHQLSETKRSTDVIVLGLKSKVKYYQTRFDTTNFFPNTTVLTGITKRDNTIYPHVEVAQILYTILDSTKATLYGILGKIGHGFSGSPVYNTKGNIIGMIVSGADNFSDIPVDLPIDLYSRIRNYYLTTDNMRVGYFLPIKEMYIRYLKGFVN
jgi:S1-C subfamily serine protease